jgi:hypothetical protein
MVTWIDDLENCDTVSEMYKFLDSFQARCTNVRNLEGR